jgi:predicted nucleic acid-binding protein
MSDRLRRGVWQIFVDSSAYYAIADPADANATAAAAILRRLTDTPTHLWTTNFVVAETHALVLNRRGRAAAWQVLQKIDRSSTTIVRVSAADERRARAIIATYDDKDFSLTDAASFAVMERLGITTAFAFDRHFAQYGLAVLTM